MQVDFFDCKIDLSPFMIDFFYKLLYEIDRVVQRFDMGTKSLTGHIHRCAPGGGGISPRIFSVHTYGHIPR